MIGRSLPRCANVPRARVAMDGFQGHGRRRRMPVWTFIRHGESVANAEGWLAGHCDTPLTERGVGQARALRLRLGELRFDRVFASDLVRARHTAELLLEGTNPEIRTTDRLRERDCGAWERRRLEDLELGGDMNLLRLWTGRPPRGESLHDVAKRVIEWLHQVDDDLDTLLVCHGALMRAVIGVMDGTPRTEVGDWRPVNCEVATRIVPAGGWSIHRAALL